MSIKSSNFLSVLSSKYIPTDSPTFIDSNKLKGTKYEKLFLETYESLGGQEEYPVVTQKGYFFETIKFAIAFDEQLNFNKYRIKTLRSSIYQSFLGIKLEKYRSFCKKYERECLKSGITRENWSSITSEHHFGKSEAPGDLGLNGSSGWKYRAFQNFLEDIYAQQSSTKLLRVSIWDEVMINKQICKIGDLLTTPSKETAEHILKYVERRVINLFA